MSDGRGREREREGGKERVRERERGERERERERERKREREREREGKERERERERETDRERLVEEVEASFPMFSLHLSFFLSFLSFAFCELPLPLSPYIISLPPCFPGAMFFHLWQTA